MHGARRPLVAALTVLVLALGVIVVAHTAEVWIWAAALLARGALADASTALYFALATFTTLGYGDIRPQTFRARTLSWMEAVVGVTFMATLIAFLVSQVVVDRQQRRAHARSRDSTAGRRRARGLSRDTVRPARRRAR